MQPQGSGSMPPRYPKGTLNTSVRTNSDVSLNCAADSASSPQAAPLDIQGHKSYNLRLGDRPLVWLSLHTPLFGEVRPTLNGG